MNRCTICSKKLKLTHAMMYQCKCKLYFCKTHVDYEHACSIDRAEDYKEKLRERLPVVSASKLERI